MPITLEGCTELGGRVVVLPVAVGEVSGVRLAVPWGFGAVKFFAVAAPLMGRLCIASGRHNQVVGLFAAREQAAVHTALTGPIFADGWDAACRNSRRGGDSQRCQLQHYSFIRAADHQIPAGVGGQLICLHGMLL